MSNVLIIYETKEGHTSKIARVLADQLRSHGHTVETYNSRDVSKNLSLSDFNGVIMGAPIHMSKYPAAFRRWIKSHAKSLDKIPTAFFSVCLGILEKDNLKTQSEIKRIAADLFAEAQLKPWVQETFAGALMYSKYNWLVRLIMKRKSIKAGGNADTSRDYIYTNWEDVRRFADTFAEQISKTSEVAIYPIEEGKVVEI